MIALSAIVITTATLVATHEAAAAVYSVGSLMVGR
jgi:hypothetical protein